MNVIRAYIALHKQEMVSKIVADLYSIKEVETIALGGSCARGTAHADSNVDLGIYYNDVHLLDIEIIHIIAEVFKDGYSSNSNTVISMRTIG
jgi:predicted nucleotidyltransferase